MFPTLFPSLGTPFLLLGCLVQPQYEGFFFLFLGNMKAFNMSYFYIVLLHLVVVFCKPALL